MVLIVILLTNPALIDAYKGFIEAIRNRMTIIVICLCTVDYEGRAGSFLEEGERIIIIKNDGSLLVHRESGYKPVNWQPPGSHTSVRLENSYLIIDSVRPKPIEHLRIRISEVRTFLALKLKDTGEFHMYLSEEELQRVLFEHPQLIEDGLRTITREKELESGKVDIFAEDKFGNPVLIEVKRGRVSEKEVLQLYKYVSEYRVTNPRVRGIIVSPKIDPKAQILLHELNLEYKSVELSKIAKLYKRFKGTTLLDY